MANGKELFAPNQTFEQYSKRFEDVFMMRRENGVIEVKMHQGGEASPWRKEFNFGWGAALRAIGADPENELLIIGGTGDAWATDDRADGYADSIMELMRANPVMFNKFSFDNYQRVSKNMRSMLFDIDIPTIGVINGPAPSHMELALLCDITLCAPNVEFRSIHFPAGIGPGDGFYAAMQELIGIRRADYLCYTGRPFSAQKAKEWGMVSELAPSDEIYQRAWDLAFDIMKQPREVRRLTHEIMREPMRQHFNKNFGYQSMASTLAGCVAMAD